MPATKKTKIKKATAIPARKMKKPAAPKSAGSKKAQATKPMPAAETAAPPKQTTVNITAAKGRPMLSWVEGIITEQIAAAKKAGQQRI